MPEPTEPNPFESPASLSPPPPRSRRRGWRIALIVVMSVVLLPAATFTAGFCCCLGSMAIGMNDNGQSMFSGFVIGAVLGGALMAFAMYKLARAIL